MSKDESAAQQGRGFYAPRFSKGLYWFARSIGRLYMRVLQKVRRIHVPDMDRLYRAMLRFQRGESRLIIMFRHVAVADGPVVIATVAQELPRWCRAHGKTLPQPPHTHYLYGKDVLNWAGAQARWAFPRLGGIPVLNGRVDKESQSTIRRVLVEGRFPLSFAPEAQVTYHQFTSFDLAAGAATLPAWTHRDATRGASDRPQRVDVLPLAIGYSYGRSAHSVLRDVSRRLCAALGARPDASRLGSPASAVQLLRELTGQFVRQAERELGLESDARRDGDDGDHSDHGPRLQERIDRLCAQALRTAERAAGARPEGTILERVFRVRAWLIMSRYREDVDLEELPPVSRALADRRARLAAAVRPYERLADILEYVSVDYLDAALKADGEGDFPVVAADRLIEYALNLLDAACRVRGGDVGTRYTPGGRIATVVPGSLIDASAVFEGADTPKSGVRALSARIHDEFISLVDRLEHECWPDG